MCRREFEARVVPTELRVHVEKWRRFFHAAIWSVPLTRHTSAALGTQEVGAGGGGGEKSKADPLPCATCISLGEADLTPRVSQRSGGGELEERDGKQTEVHF